MTTTTDNQTRFRHDATPQNGTAVMVDRYNLGTHRTERVRATIVGIAAVGSLHCDAVFSVEANGEVFAARASDCFACANHDKTTDATVAHREGETTLVNTHGYAWRVVNGGWRRAGEGETSRDGFWVVGGGQWRFGC